MELKSSQPRGYGIPVIASLIGMGVSYLGMRSLRQGVLYAPKRYLHNPILQEEKWERTLKQVAPSIVEIRITGVRGYDGDGPGQSYATAFVVDKTRGIMLTNRHVVCVGPVVTDAVFQNREEVAVRSLYRDPVHDFGFLAFNPLDIRFMQLQELELAPNEAKVGIEIKVVGNDNGEKLAILSSTLARLDRNAPHYGSKSYNDFNTFYYGAASNTSGGSSGSPVINIEGKVVALNAGGASGAASSYYLPLQRVVRALKLLREGWGSPPTSLIPRGDLGTYFRYTPFGEAKDLGLQASTEAEIRKTYPSEIGILVVKKLIPGGPSANMLEAGDILIRVQNQICTSYHELEAILDQHVGQLITVEVERHGIPYKFQIRPQNLHTKMPNAFLQVSFGIFHSLSYQQALNSHLTPGLVYFAYQGYMWKIAGIPAHTVILEVGEKKISSLKDLEQALSVVPHNTKIPIRYMTLDKHEQFVKAILMDRRWDIMTYYEYNEKQGSWESHPSPLSLEKEKSKPGKVAFSSTTSPLANQILPSLCTVEFTTPYQIDGVDGDHFVGIGIVIDIKQGLVIVEKNTVPVSIGDIRLTFASTVEVSGRLFFVHPIHNFCIIQYDPTTIDHSDKDGVQEAKLSYEPLQVGEETFYVGLTEKGNAVWQTCTVSEDTELKFHMGHIPRFRETNLDVLRFAEVLTGLGGVFVNKDGFVQALWVSFAYDSKGKTREQYEGLPIRALESTIKLLSGDLKETSPLYYVEAELDPISLSSASSGMGLSEAWVDKLTRANPSRRQVLSVRRTAFGTDSAAKLKSGDLLLAVNDQPVTTFLEVEHQTHTSKDGLVNIDILRDKKEQKIIIQATKLSSTGTDEVVSWSGLLLQPPHRAVTLRAFLPVDSGVYISRYFFGSPAHKYGVMPLRWITHINSHPTPTISAFLKAVEELKDRQTVLVKTIDLLGVPRADRLKTDFRFWPTRYFKQKDHEWTSASLNDMR